MTNNIFEDLLQLLQYRESEIIRLNDLIENLRMELWEVRQGIQILCNPPMNTNTIQEYMLFQYEQEIQDLRMRNAELRVELEVYQTTLNRDPYGVLEEATSSNYVTSDTHTPGKREIQNEDNGPKKEKKAKISFNFLKGKNKNDASSSGTKKE